MTSRHYVNSMFFQYAILQYAICRGRYIWPSLTDNACEEVENHKACLGRRKFDEAKSE